MTEQLKPSGRFTKKPVTIDAWRIDLNNAQPDWVRTAFGHDVIDWSPDGEGLYINTLEGLMVGNIRDWLIRGIKEELYACKSEIFDATYSPADEGAQPAQAGQVPELTSTEVNDACWAFVEALPHQLPGAIFNDLKPAIYAAICKYLEQSVLAKRVPQWIATADQMPPPDTWLLVAWDGGRVDKAHTFNKWEHPTNPLGYLIQGHPGAHVDVTHWKPLPPPPGIVGEKGGA